MCWRLCMGLLCGQSASLLSRGRGQPSLNVSLRPCGPGSSPVLSAGSWPRGCLAGGHGGNLHSLWPVGPPVLFRWLSQCLKGRNPPHFVCWTHPSSVLYRGIARGWGGCGAVCPLRTQPRLPGTWSAALPLSSRAPSIPACSPLRPVISAAPSTLSVVSTVELIQPQLLYLPPVWHWKWLRLLAELHTLCRIQMTCDIVEV